MDLEEEREGRHHGGRVEWGAEEKRMGGGGRAGWSDGSVLGWVAPRRMARLSRAKACGATQPCHVRTAGTRVPAWQLGRAEACGVTLQGVAPRGLARPKGLVLGNLDLNGLLLKY